MGRPCTPPTLTLTLTLGGGLRTNTYVDPLRTYNVRCFQYYALLELAPWVRYVNVMALF
jgi:hypothetical protein